MTGKPSDNEISRFKLDVLVWHRLDRGAPPPDSDRAVLVSLADSDGLTWLGFFDSSNWVDASTGGPILSRVIAFAELPEGPR